jgi:hypothetical protein
MNRLLTVLLLTGFAFAQGALTGKSSGNVQPSLGETPGIASSVGTAGDLLGSLPPTPAGKASFIGGSLRTLDPLRDRIIVQVFGGGSSAILFDARTRVYRDGQIASFKDLSAGQHIYVETVLDKADVFARSIHIATQDAAAEQSTGQLLNYDPKSQELVLRDALFPKPVKLHLDQSTTILNGDQTVDAAQLRSGALLSVRFTISAGHEPVARQVSILAQPGTAFVFPGRVTLLDLHTRVLVISDPRDNRSYELYCDPGVVPVPEDLREGSNVTVTASFDGTRYSATGIAVNRQSK